MSETAPADGKQVRQPSGAGDGGTSQKKRAVPGTGGGSGGRRLVTDGVVDQHRRRWVRIGSDEAGRWFKLADLASGDRAVFRELADGGLPILTPGPRSALLREVEAFADYRPALVADRPGWTGTPGGTWHYVLGDGAVVGPPDVPSTEVIVAFGPDAKITQRGKLGDWQAAMEPFVAGQTLPVSVLCLGLAPPLLTLAPPDFGNQLCEIAGPSGHGKSTLAFLAASVWAGDPARETLGAESWLTTLEAIDRQMAAHADALLVLDEANKAGSSRKKQRELIEKAIFRLSGTEGKARYATGVEVSGARLLTISTSNEPLAQLLEVTPAVMQALQARMVTFEVSSEGPLRAFDRVPHGFASERKAVEALLGAIATRYGRFCCNV